MERLAKQPSVKGPEQMFTGDVAVVQARGGEVVGIRPGDVIYTPPGEWHWHGTAPGHVMTHIALWEAPAPDADIPESEWGEHVTDEEYRATPSANVH